MIIDGKKIANRLKEEIKFLVLERAQNVSLGIIYVGENKVIENFTRIKKKFSQDVGISTTVYNFKDDIQKEELISEIIKISKEHDGVIVQLPLPVNLPVKEILNSIPKDKDIDLLSEESLQYFVEGHSKILPPVTGAIKEIFNEYKVELNNKKILIIGQGRLVGLPTYYWLKNLGLEPYFVDKNIMDITPYTKNADIIISGAGSPGLIKPEMIKDGTILIDAGTSENSGKILGDMSPECASKCLLYTPVPGGVGPVAIAIIFKNLLQLVKSNEY